MAAQALLLCCQEFPLACFERLLEVPPMEVPPVEHELCEGLCSQ